jgi:hypothetical protein
MKDKKEKIIVAISFIIAVLITISSFNGAFSGNLYFKETLNWQVQSVGQDYINLLIAPVLMITAILIYMKKPYGLFLWAGTLLFFIYTYLIYCFNIHFNVFFIEYCIVLGLSVYSFFYFLYIIAVKPPADTSSKFHSLQGYYFIIIALLFAFLWLSEVIPSILNNSIPQSLAEVGLFTNPVHVLDLSLFLPGTFLTGIFLIRKRKIAFLLAPVLFTFFILMSITIAVLNLLMVQRGISSGISVAVAMVVLAILSSIILFLSLSKLKTH